jgi:hypothetical protein
MPGLEREREPLGNLESAVEGHVQVKVAGTAYDVPSGVTEDIRCGDMLKRTRV